MSRFYIVGGLVAAGLLVSCAAAPEQVAQTDSSALSDAKSAANSKAPVGTRGPNRTADTSLPAESLTPELLYQLMVAEVALQRGQPLVAAENYLRAAQTTRDPRIARRATRIAVYAQDRSRALKAADLWVKLAPQEQEARQALAALLIQDGQVEEALPHLRQLLTLGKEERGLETVVLLLGSVPKQEHPLQLFDRLTKGRQSHAIEYAGARLALLIGKPEVALERVNQLLLKRPKSSEALVLKANILRHLNRPKEAIEAFRDAVNAVPDDPKLRLSFARLLVDAGEIPAAREQFAELARQMPGNPDVTYAQGLLALEAGDLDEAEKHFKALRSGEQYANEAAFSLGRVAEERGNDKEAMHWYSTVSRGKNFVSARARMATIVARTKGVEQADKFLAAVQPANEEEKTQLILAQGELLREHERYGEAKRVYDRALVKQPDNPDLLYARAIVSEQLGHLDLLERDLRAILKQDPNNAQALNALGYTLADRTTRYEEARGYISRALEQSPDDPGILDSMGWVLYRMGRNEDALGYLRKAAGEISDPEVSAHLGEVLWVTGRQKEARQVLEEASKRFPDSKVLQRVIDKFL